MVKFFGYDGEQLGVYRRTFEIVEKIEVTRREWFKVRIVDILDPPHFFHMVNTAWL
jgi:hypothetical protein